MKKIVIFILAVAMVFVPTYGWAATTAPSASVTLVVNPLPTATVNGGASVNVFIGDIVNLAVNSPGTSTGGNPTYAWGATGGTLSATNVATPTLNTAGLTAGAYTAACTVTNDVGAMTSNTVTINVFDPSAVIVTITSSTGTIGTLPNVEGNTGSAVTFTATVSSGTITSCVWYHDGNPIAGQTTATLTLSSPTTADSGAITVVANVTP